MVISGFYENVPQHLYEHRELAPGEKEKKNLILEFDPKPSKDMLVACLWDHRTCRGEPSLDSFAAITDVPTPGSRGHWSSAHDHQHPGTVSVRMVVA